MKNSVVTNMGNKITGKKMDDAVFALRRQVIALIYEAKRLVPSLPRIEVRVAHNHREVLGCATMGAKCMWITEKSVASRAVVFHEILHAAYAVKHVAGCPLMNPVMKSEPSQSVVDSLFVKYSQKAGQLTKA